MELVIVMTKNRWLTYSRRRKALVAKMRDNQIGQRLGIEVMASVPIVYTPIIRSPWASSVLHSHPSSFRILYRRYRLYFTCLSHRS